VWNEIAANDVGPEEFEAREVGVVVIFANGGRSLVVENYAGVRDVATEPEAVNAMAPK